MKRISLLFLIFAVFLVAANPLSVFGQPKLSEKEKWQGFEDYVNMVIRDWETPGVAIAIVKEDKIIYSGGFGVKELSAKNIAGSIPTVSEAYAKLFKAVKSKEPEAIKRLMSKTTLEFAKRVAEKTNQPYDKVFENGFYASTMTSNLPDMRDERVKGVFGAIEVWIERDKVWEDVAFVFEEGEWKLAVGDIFSGAYKSPGFSKSTLEKIKQPKALARPAKNQKGSGFGSASGNKINSPKVDSPISKSPDNFTNPANNIDQHTLFAIASNSKAFTATAIAMLIDEGKLGWDDKVIKHLPDFKLYDEYASKEITIRDLLSHKSGLPAYGGDITWWGANHSRDEIVRRVRFVKPQHSFRYAYTYQNIPFIIAGQIIEKVSGKSWDDFIKERILRPLKMNETTTSIRDFTPSSNITTPHFRDLEGKTIPITWRNLDNGAAAAGLNSNVVDMANWLRFQINEGEFEGKRLVSAKAIQEMQSPQTIIKFNNPPEPRLFSNFHAYGLGWSLREYQGNKMVMHGGWADGQLSMTAMIPGKKAGVVVLSNIHNRDTYIPLVYTALDIALSSPQNEISKLSPFVMKARLREQKSLLEREYRAKHPKVMAIQSMIDRLAPYQLDWSDYFLKIQLDAEKKQAEQEARILEERDIAIPSPPLSFYSGAFENELYGRVEIGYADSKFRIRLMDSPSYIGTLIRWRDNRFRITWDDPVAEKSFIEFSVKEGKSIKMSMAMDDFIDDGIYEYFRVSN